MQNLNIKTKLLYIMGAGRSGSTILSIILGSHPKVISVGEIKAWPKYEGLPRDKIDKKNIIFWEKVLDTYISLSGRPPNFAQLKDLCNEIESPNKLLLNLLNKQYFLRIKDYIEHINNLISSILIISKKNIVLDSSKNVCRALFLLKFLNTNVKVIYLIRDPRGTLWSFMKKNVEQKPKKPVKAIIDYVAINSAASFTRYLFRKQVIKVRYEDLVLSPEKEIATIAQFIGIYPKPLTERFNSKKEFKIKYLIDGNRVRKNNCIKFKADEEWKNKLPKVYKILCKIIASPIYYI